MKVIWKFQLDIEDLQTLSVPKGSKPVSVASQHGIYTLWILCDPEEKETEGMTIRIAGTGQPIEEEIISHIGTILDLNGTLVLHFLWVK